MPVEIKELIIRAVVDRQPASLAGDAGSAPASGDSQAPDTEALDTEAIIGACVKQVLKVLDKARER